jgi:hypothetical protein
MLGPDVKRLAYATMDDAHSFELHIAASAPAGDFVVELLRAATIDEVLPAAQLVRKMANTFFGKKLMAVSPRPDVDGPVGLYIVAELPELQAADLVALSEEGALRMIEE